MNVLSLFDGMSGGQIALVDSLMPYGIYYASEVDKHAIAQTQLNFPNTIQLGDVRDIDVSKLRPIDLLIGGSPCQSFSFAGKRNGMSTKCQVEITTLEQYLQLKAEGFEFEGQSYLFWEYMRILRDIREYNPDVKFLLENVEMGKKWERVLSEAIGIFGVHINSTLVSAQNRKRIYWTNIRVKKVGLFGELHSDIPQPADRGILLKDILEGDVDEKYYLSDKMVGTLGLASGEYLKLDKRLNPKPNQHKASAFTAGTHSGGNHSDMDLICVAMRGRNPDDPSDRTAGAPTEQRLEPNLHGKTNCLTSVQKDNLVMQINPSLESGGKQPYQQNRVYDPEGISPALCANKADLIIQLKAINHRVHGVSFNNEGIRPYRNDEKKSGIQELETIATENTKTSCLTTNHEPKCLTTRIRRLTPTECARLQTIPEWYRWECSDTQQYRMLGNGWTVEVIKHIFQYL